MKTKLIKTFLLGFVALGMLIGCDNENNEASPSSNNTNPSQSSADASNDASSSSDSSSDAGSSSSDASSSDSSNSSNAGSSDAGSSDAGSSDASSDSSGGGNSQAPSNRTFPVALVTNYFASEGEEVEIPAIVAPDFAQNGFEVRDGMLGGVMVEVSCNRDTMIEYFQAFFDCGWFVCHQVGDQDEWVMNYIGFTGAYVDFWFNRYSISFDFFVDDIPEEDPSLDPDMGPLSTSYPFPSANVVAAVYTPNNITVVMPEYNSPTTSFSLANFNQGVSVSVIAQNFPADEQTALINAFKAVGWALKDGSENVYKYSTTAAIFTVQGNARFFQLVFAIDA